MSMECLEASHQRIRWRSGGVSIPPPVGMGSPDEMIGSSSSLPLTPLKWIVVKILESWERNIAYMQRSRLLKQDEFKRVSNFDLDGLADVSIRRGRLCIPFDIAYRAAFFSILAN